jgi:hypothetical protein
MLGRIAAAAGDAIGTGQGENCHVLFASQFMSDTSLTSYLIPGETPYIVLRSYKEEYIFTDYAFISIKGHSTVGTKKVVTRYDYADHKFTLIALRTPGVVNLDMDGVLHLVINEVDHEIDIRKAEWENVKYLYRALIMVKRAQYQNEAGLVQCRESTIYANITDTNKLSSLMVEMVNMALHNFRPLSYKSVWEASSIPK